MNERKSKYKNVAGISWDCASNIDAEASVPGYADMICSAHAVQLALNAALNHNMIPKCISTDKDVVSHFNHPAKAKREMRRQNGIALLHDVATG